MVYREKLKRIRLGIALKKRGLKLYRGVARIAMTDTSIWNIYACCRARQPGREQEDRMPKTKWKSGTYYRSSSWIDH